MDQHAGPRRHRLALVVGPTLFAHALASVLAADEVDEVIDLTVYDDPGGRFDAAVISPGAEIPDADVVIVLPPSGSGEVLINVRGSIETERVEVPSVASLFDLLDAYDPADRPRRRS